MWLSMTSVPTVDQTRSAATTTGSVAKFAKNIRLIILSDFHNTDEVRIITDLVVVACLLMSFFTHHVLPNQYPFYSAPKTLWLA